MLAAEKQSCGYSNIEGNIAGPHCSTLAILDDSSLQLLRNQFDLVVTNVEAKTVQTDIGDLSISWQTAQPMQRPVVAFSQGVLPYFYQVFPGISLENEYHDNVTQVILYLSDLKVGDTNFPDILNDPRVYFQIQDDNLKSGVYELNIDTKKTISLT